MIKKSSNAAKQHNGNLQDIAWLLEDEEKGLAQPKPPNYGDVTELNTERTILDGVGQETLKMLAEDIMSLLDTSVAVYEKNGDYAYGSFVSEWCSLMDGASRELCNTSDNRKALNCGRWLCHENCWNDSAKAAMESGKITDIACVGGIRLYSVPIMASGDSIGVINMGHGNPPTDEETLKDLSRTFGCDRDSMRKAAEAFNPRPPFLIDIAKKRLQSIAVQIGRTVEAAQNEEKLKDVARFLEENRNPVLRVDNEMRLLYANPAAMKLIVEPGTNVGDKISAQWHSLVQEAWSNVEPMVAEVTLHGKVYAFSSTAISDRGYVNVYATDITERKRAEDALRKNMEWLDETTRIASVGGWVIDISGNTLEWTKETFRIHELPFDAPPDVNDAIEFYHPEDRPRVAALVQHAMESGEDFDFEARVITAKKNLVWVRAIGRAIFCENCVVGVRGTVQDISARKQAEEAIATEKERLSVTLRSIGDGVITTDMNGDVVLMNNVAEELTGWKQNEAEGKSLGSVFTIINETTREPHENPVQKVLSSGRIIELANHTLLISRDGTERIIADSGAPIKDKEGHTIGVVLVFRDITEKQRILEMMQNSQKLESLGVLAGGIAHDCNNLLGGIFGYVDMASEATKEVNVTSYLAKAMNTIERTRALTRHLLTFAKGGAPIQQIGTLFPFVQKTAQFALSGSSVACNFDIPPDLWACNFDRSQIGQVIDNLIINAQQAMPVGGTIELSARNSTLAEKEHPLLGKGNYVKIAIKDAGIGIAKELITKIFDPFFTTKAKGHGLGLATCYSIINRHGGCIDVESEQGKGSTFKVYLPASLEAASAAIKPTDRTHKGSGTFLIMDDEEVMRDTIGDMLESLGYTVISKNNGKDAIDCFLSETKANREIAGMVFDLTVPGGMGGKEAIEVIRKTTTKIPCFVASGYADDPVMKNPAEYGFMASICKPFRRIELMEMLAKHMKTRD